MLLVAAAVLALIAPVGWVYRTPTDYLHQVLVLLAFGLVVPAVVGLHVRHRGQRRYGWFGTVAAGLTAIGYAAVTLIVLVGLVAGGRVLNEVRVGFAIALLIGSALLGIAVLLCRLLPWWCGVLLIVAFPLGDAANAVFAASEYLLLAVTWGLVGAALLSPVTAGTRSAGGDSAQQ